MKKGMIALLSALALALAFAGCSGSDGSFSSAGDVVENIDVDGVTDVSKAVNEFGLDPALGTPPALPAS